MVDDRRTEILNKLTPGATGALRTRKLCEVCAEVTRTTGAGIMLMSGDSPQGSACSSNDTSALIERLQFDLGEGPCVDAYRTDRVVLEPDLAAPATPRWLAFSEPALTAGVRAVFGFPLRAGTARIGALNLYSDEPGLLTEDQHADALAMSDIAAQTLLAMQAAAPPGRLAPALEAGGNFPFVVHQASGMVAAQLGVTVGQALLRLRTHAFGNDQPLLDVAHAVVARELRFTDDIGSA